MTTGILKKTHPVRAAIIMMFNPGEILKSSLSQIPWPFSLAVSTISFALFFLQTGLDLWRTGQGDIAGALLLAAQGAGLGLVGVALLGALAWVLSKAAGGKKPFTWAISAFGLSYCSTFIYGAAGLIAFFALGWNASVAFGVTGVLWATGPIIATIREMTNGRTVVSVIIATCCSSLLLLGWAFLGNR